MKKALINVRMPGIMILAIVLGSIVFAAGCSKNTNSGNSSNTGSTGSTSTTSTSSSSSGSTASSPTAALRAYYQAAMNKDIPAAKRYLSAGTMAMMEEGARKMGKSLDDAFKEGAAQTPPTAMPEFSNEKINGDTATVDMKVEGMTLTMPLVKEGGEWKLAMDKMIEDMKSSMGGGVQEPADESKDEHGGHDEK